ncbi:hypothetical protein VTN77DRAFT_6697 [Rasamsonia byssochlamydoides]|uniref:uncharacterized protein n=1 Tax=Rasamsonia byssochlamydoides TaxID=89139 RepID=UPI0037447389
MTANDNPYITSSTRSKLNNFRYVPTEEEPAHPEKSPSKATSGAAANGDKENQISWMNRVAEPTNSPSKSQPSTQAKEAKPVKECPKTPANRIPLADLISNTEDAFKLAPGKELTPDDYVSWQHVPRSSDPPSVTPATRGKKRRHSSSPTSSPLRKGLEGGTKELLLKTPQNDMATDLWNNYVGKSKIEGNVELPPQFANLSSSPQTPLSAKTGRDSSGLRRSVSCNVDWPASKTKRRRIEGREDMRSIFSRSKSNVLDSGNSKSSKLSFLLDKIQESLAKSTRAKTGAPSVSPPQDRGDVSGNRSPSSGEGKRKSQAAGQPIHEATEEAEKSHCQTDAASEAKAQESSSEFGDDDLDEDLLALVESSTDPFIDSTKNQKMMSETSFNKTGFDPEQSPSPAEHGNRQRVSASNADAQKDDDEFDDDDEFPENMEELLAQYDEKTPVKRGNSPRQVGQESVNSTVHIGAAHSSVASGRQVQGSKKSEDISSGDEFDDEDFDLAAIEDSMLQSRADACNQKHKAQQAIKRYLIVNIAESTYVTSKGRTQPDQVLSVEDEKTGDKKVIILRESWFDSPCTKNSYIHLIGDFDSRGQCIVDNSNNMIILHPDHLISATVVADAIGCQRRAVLQDRIKATADISKAQVFGHILHEVFQEAMKANRWELDWLRTMVEEVLVRYVESLYAIHISMIDAVEYVMSKIPELKAWADMFLRAKPSAESLVEDRHGSKASLSINKLLEVEEHIWSPMYGLKGNVDATVQVVYDDGEDERTLTVPLEVKTGKKDTSHSHRAQTALYTLLLSDRYDIDVTFGLLYYLEMRKTFRVRGVRHELLQMIQERNRLACYVREKVELPPMLKRPHMCNQCYSKTACFVYHKLMDDGDGESSGMGDKFDEAVGHLNVKHRDFFRKWDDLLTKEEKDMMKFRRELWTMLSSERESLGRCFGNVIIEPGSAYEDKNGPKINRYQYTFIKQKAAPDFSFTESQITTGEPIVISDEKGHFALANGYVLHISPKRITVAVDRRLHNARIKGPGFDPERNQTFNGIMEICDEEKSDPIKMEGDEEQILYRLDKDEFSNGMATVRNNLICMMEKDLFQAQQLRRLIIEGQEPSFKPVSSSCMMSSSAQASLNVDQKQAIEKVMSARDYALVLGMPGTGKTTTIAHIIRALVSQGKSVLLTSYTHTAVDNILLKIRDDNIRILRLGAPAKVHPEVQQFADLAAIPKKTIEELQESYEQSRVVATTCLGVNHPIFNERVFDYCIVDEASQITLPVCLGPIRMAKTFILVGDHYQLPPLVQSKEAQKGGLDVSLFKLLSDAHPSSVVNLEHQYRMCEEIMLLSNTLIYSGRLKCGTPEVASRSLEIPNLNSGLKRHHATSLAQFSSQRSMCLGPNHGRCWLRDLLDPSAKTRLVNTDTLSGQGPECVVGSRIVNNTEATICTQLVHVLVSSGISPRDIGVITFYRSQLSLLKQTLRCYAPLLEMHTADKFQGRDKEVVILSCVRSNPDKNVGELLRDWRRVNVAFTRARTKLLVIGSRTTLRDGNELLHKYVYLMESHGWVYNLPKNAIEDHIFEDSEDLSQRISGIVSPTQSPSKSQKKSANSTTTPDQKKRRNPLSPIKGNNVNKTMKRKPEKIGAKALPGDKILSKRPILQDVVNDIIG